MTAGGIVTLGETMALMSAAEIGSWAGHRDLKLSIAGAESNVSIGVRRLGRPATWISRVGDDGFGELILRELRAEGVTAAAATDSGHPTGLMVKERPNTLRTHVRYYRAGSAAAAMSVDDIDAGTITSASLLHITGITPALGAGPASAVRHAIDIAREAGMTVSLDVNYRSALWSRDAAAASLSPLVGLADLVFAGPEEASLVVTEDEPEPMARAIVELGPAQVVIKLGADGAVSYVDGVVRTTSAVPVQVVDTVGAGDAFVAGYLADLLDGQDADVRLDTAAAAGAFACTALGDWEGLPTRRDLTALGAGDNVRR